MLSVSIRHQRPLYSILLCSILHTRPPSPPLPPPLSHISYYHGTITHHHVGPLSTSMQLTWTHSFFSFSTDRFSMYKDSCYKEKTVVKIPLPVRRHLYIGKPPWCPLSNGVNPLHAKFFRGNRNIYLYSLPFLYIDLTQVLETLPQVRYILDIFYIVNVMAGDVLAT